MRITDGGPLRCQGRTRWCVPLHRWRLRTVCRPPWMALMAMGGTRGMAVRSCTTSPCTQQRGLDDKRSLSCVLMPVTTVHCGCSSDVEVGLRNSAVSAESVVSPTPQPLRPATACARQDSSSRPRHHRHMHWSRHNPRRRLVSPFPWSCL